jgi:hypothetical protein
MFYPETAHTPSYPKKIELGKKASATISKVALKAKTDTEWLIESGINPAFYEASCQVKNWQERNSDGLISHPFIDELNWKGAGRQAGAFHYAYNLLTRERTIFQCKPATPIKNGAGKPAKYVTPSGRSQVAGAALPELFEANGGALWFGIQLLWKELLNLDLTISCPINGKPTCPIDGQLREADIYGYWDWYRDNPAIPLITDEGLKKALCLLTYYFIAIALAGVTMGRVTRGGEAICLQPDLQLLADPDRPILLCFDTDPKTSTRAKVAKAQLVLGQLFKKAGCKSVSFIQLPLLENGKGAIDDLIVSQGIQAFRDCFNKPVDIDSYQQYVQSVEWLAEFESQRQIKPTELQHQRYIDVSKAPTSGIIVLISAKNTGKTYALSWLIKDEDKVIALSHLIALCRNICRRLGLAFRNDLDQVNGQWIDDGEYADLTRFGLCVHSILMLEIAKYAGGTLVWDELDQGLRELITGKNCNQQGQRAYLLLIIEQLLKTVNRVIVSSADITDAELEWICKVRGDLNPYIIKNTFKPDGYPVYVFPQKAKLLSQLLDDIEAGQKPYVFCDSKALADEIYAVLVSILGADRVLLITSDTTPKDQGAIDYMLNPNAHADRWQVVIASPSACTGISIETDCYDCVYGFIEGKSILGSDVAQALARVRATVPRKIWVRKSGTRFSRFSKSTDYQEILQVLETGANNEIRILCAMFKMMLPTFNLADNPHAIYWAKSEANRNTSMLDLRIDVIERLRYDGNFVFEVDYKKLPKHEKERIADNTNIFKGQSDQIKAAYKQQYLNAPRLPDNDFKDLAAKKIKTPVEQITVKANYTMRDFGVEQMTEDLFNYADNGNNRTRLFETLYLIAPGYAATESHKHIEKMHQHGHGLTAWDIKTCTARTQLRRELGLLDLYLDLLANPNQTLTNENCKTIVDQVRDRLDEVKAILKPTFKSHWGNYAIVKNLLEQLLIDFDTDQETTGDRNRTVTVNLKTLQQHEHVLRHNYKSRNLEGLNNLFLHCNDTMGDIWAVQPLEQPKMVKPPEPSQGEMRTPEQMKSEQMNQYKTSLADLCIDHNQTNKPVSTNNNQLVDIDPVITSSPHGLNISTNGGAGARVETATVNPHESALAASKALPTASPEPVATIPIKRETANLADRIAQFLKAEIFPEPSPTCHTIAYNIDQAVVFKSASEALTEGTKVFAGGLSYESSLSIWGLLSEPTRAKLAAMVFA